MDKLRGISGISTPFFALNLLEATMGVGNRYISLLSVGPATSSDRRRPVGFASPPRDGFALVVDEDMIPRKAT